MARPRVVVTEETSSGRNQQFHDNHNGQDMTRAQFVKKIEAGCYENYHIRTINDIKTPASDPNDREYDNLG